MRLPIGPATVLGDRVIESLLAGRSVPDEPELTRALTALRSLPDAEQPRPSASLATLLSEGLVGAVAPRTAATRPTRRWARTGVALSAVILSISGGMVGAAAANVLPAAAQRAVADAVGALTEVQLPRPNRISSRPAEAPTHHAPAHRPAPAPALLVPTAAAPDHAGRVAPNTARPQVTAGNEDHSGKGVPGTSDAGSQQPRTSTRESDDAGKAGTSPNGDRSGKSQGATSDEGDQSATTRPAPSEHSGSTDGSHDDESKTSGSDQRAPSSDGSGAQSRPTAAPNSEAGSGK